MVREDQVFLIKMKVDGLPCWHYVEVPKIKMPLMERFNKGEKLDVKDFGTIIHSGWGLEPDRDDKIELKKRLQQ